MGCRSTQETWDIRFQHSVSIESGLTSSARSLPVLEVSSAGEALGRIQTSWYIAELVSLFFLAYSSAARVSSIGPFLQLALVRERDTHLLAMNHIFSAIFPPQQVDVFQVRLVDRHIILIRTRKIDMIITTTL